MTPHYLLDHLDDVLHRLQRGDTEAAKHIVRRLHEEAKREAIEWDAWASKEEMRNYVG